MNLLGIYYEWRLKSVNNSLQKVQNRIETWNMLINGFNGGFDDLYGDEVTALPSSQKINAVYKKRDTLTAKKERLENLVADYKLQPAYQI